MKKDIKKTIFRLLQIIITSIIFFIITSCGVQINNGIINNLAGNITSADSDEDTNNTTNYIVDQTDDDNSVTGFGGGTHLGTTYSSDTLTLNITTNTTQLNESWTPSWSSVVSYWPLDNSLNDNINSHHLSDNGVTYSAAAKMGDATGVFDGSTYSSTADHSDFNFNTNLSAMAWIKASTQLDTTIIGQFLTTGDQRSWKMGSGSTFHSDTGSELRFGVYVDGTNNASSHRIISSSIDVFNNKWNHVAVTFNSGTLKMYINGIEDTNYTTHVSGTVSTLFDSTTNLMVGSHGSSAAPNAQFTGNIDEVAVWNTTLSADEIELIYKRQAAKYSGEMKSRIIDSHDTNSSWTNIEWVTTLPYGKELPGNIGNESTNDYSKLVGSTGALGDDDLMSDLTALWHFNGNLQDSSGNGYNLSNNGGVDYINHGLFDGGIDTDGGSARVSSNLGITGYPFTFAAWIRLDRIPSSTEVVMDLSTSSSTNTNYAIVVYTGGWASVRLRTGGSFSTTSSANIGDGKWHHVVARFDSWNSRSFYLDGKLVGTNTASEGFTAANRFAVGIHYDASPLNVSDFMYDEVAVWRRSLDDSEILQLYQRGINNIQFQIRSCANSDCSDQDILTGDGWKGPGGNHYTFFNELFNNTSITTSCGIMQECYDHELSLSGDINLSGPASTFSEFGTDGLLQLNQNRYFQYRVLLESDDDNTACNAGTQTCMPELKSVTIGPGHSYEQ